MSVQVYQNAVRKTSNPREVEYHLLSRVTAELGQISGVEGRKDLKKFSGALDWNRRVWSVLALDCSSSENSLPPETRAGIISLSMFVGRHTSKVMREGEDVETLININRTIMEGLSGSKG